MHDVLPTHPSMRHPLTGEPIRAIWRRPDGRLCWPVMGGDETTDAAAAAAKTASDAAAAKVASDAAAAGANATDGDGKDLGYPKDTPVAQMTEGQKGAYWQHQAQKHEGRFKNLVGDRSFDDTKKALEEYERLQREQQTPAEQALADARNEGKNEGLTAARTEAASAIFRGALESGGLKADEIDDLVANLNVANFIGDNGIETAKLTTFAKRFTPSDKGTQQPGRRDFGAGRRQDGETVRGAAGRAMAAKRGFIKDDSTKTGS